MDKLSLTDQIAKEIESQVAAFTPKIEKRNIGFIVRLTDGIAVVSGLSKVQMGELVLFPGNLGGLVLNLKEDEVGVAILGDYTSLREGDEAKSTGQILNVKASDAILGRVINPLGAPLDGAGKIDHGKDARLMPVEKIAPGVVARSPVNTPLQTGIKAIDGMIPIGRGQRELIIGDRNTGKTAIVVDTIINQARENKRKENKPVISIYVAIGQKQSKVAQVVNKLEEMGAMKETIVMAANASDPVALQYLAPYAGVAIGEYFLEKGGDVLIAYDDLTKHAWAYRQISLILRRPSGREAYPGDIFYLHSRLLERACHLNEKYGGGSITALPIIETQAGDISSYIPTNVISITDGQIYLESDLFYQGVRPAINVGLSVSRVGGAAQRKSMKQVAGKLRLDLAQYNELAAFAQFGSDLDPVSRAKIERGLRTTEVLKQPQYQPKAVEEQVIEIWLVTNGYLDERPVEECRELSEQFARYVFTNLPGIKDKILSKEGLDEETIKKLQKSATDFLGK